MSRKICVAQSVEELKFILKNIKKEEVMCVPLDLPTQLFCMKNKLNFYDPINFIDNNFYKEALLESENLINKLNNTVHELIGYHGILKTVLQYRKIKC